MFSKINHVAIVSENYAKSACFSSTVTATPARASRKPSIMPAGPPPAMQHVVLIVAMSLSTAALARAKDLARGPPPRLREPPR